MFCLLIGVFSQFIFNIINNVGFISAILIYLSVYLVPFIFFCNPFVVFQLLSHVQPFVTPWTLPCQASLSFTISQILLRLMSIESMMPSNHLILSSVAPFSLPALSLSQDQSLFQWVSTSHQHFILPMNTVFL